MTSQMFRQLKLPLFFVFDTFLHCENMLYFLHLFSLSVTSFMNDPLHIERGLKDALDVPPSFFAPHISISDGTV